MFMETTLVPCNSQAEIDSCSSNTFFIPPTKSSTISCISERKQRGNFSDAEIINNCMSPEKRKSLMPTEQNDLKFITKLKTSNSPEKRFNALAPSEYGKFVLINRNVKISSSEMANFDYPVDVLSCSQIKEIKNLHQEEYLKLKDKGFKTSKEKKKSIACNLF
ncbi:hypothetical protein SteCoe_17788 [Stentor coeruleus]|uniref:Uncharacterized protein n=1 Tax=Stentor coeruleus TaxID=5963 RepID=A0A1R2BY49_9CILI|nr:hypothetical protein SteCoe_17788 [Stentor coeruleus]